MTDGDTALSEKRVYAGGSARRAFIASENGLVRVAVSDDHVGEFGLAVQDDIRDVAAGDGRVAAAGTDIFLSGSDGFIETGFGSADAVGLADELVAAGQGKVARHDNAEWTEVGQVEQVRAIADDLLAAETGVHRLDGTHVGLKNARDVAVGRDVFAATTEGLYALANGWMRRLEGGFRAVTTGAGRTVAVATDGRLYERQQEEWITFEVPWEPVDAAATAEAVYAVTADGTFLANAGDGWRERTLGLAKCRRLAIPSTTD